MPGPADNIEIIEKNLKVFSTIAPNRKLMRPDRLTGLYSLSGTFRGRSDEDSIKVQAPNIREVFNLAGISAGFMLDNNERNRWFKLISDARIGIDNLMETYENQVWANVSQKDAIDELTTEIDIQVGSMQAFLATREKYSVGYKSSNKKYASTSSEFLALNKQASALSKAFAPVNKLKYGLSGRSVPTYQDRNKKAESLINDLRNQRSYFGPLTKLAAATQDKLLAGNCSELAEYAAELVVRSGLRNVMICSLRGKYLNREGDHVFILVGAGRRKKVGTILKDQDKMNLYNENFWVIDPWANICCPCSFYPVAFGLKADNWAEKEKMVRVNKPSAVSGPNSPHQSEWVNPSEDWYRNSVKNIDWTVIG